MYALLAYIHINFFFRSTFKFVGEFKKTQYRKWIFIFLRHWEL